MATLIGRPAPDFKTKAVKNNLIIENFSLSYYRGKYIVLFFYPLDFTFVCPTELHAFQDSLAEFEKRQAQVLACSVDSCYAHHAWLNTPKIKGGIEGITYPLISDLNKTIASDYGVLHPSEGIAYRGLFLIDREGLVRHQLVNDLPLGRSVEETLRTLDALIYFETHGEVCPANWKIGKSTLLPTAEGVEKYFTYELQQDKVTSLLTC